MTDPHSLPVPLRPAPLDLHDLTEEAREYIRSAKSEATRRAYRSDWQDFASWCDQRERASLPATPETVCLYLVERARTCKAATLSRRLTSISQAHRAAGHPSPCSALVVRETWRGIRRTIGTAQEQKAPAVAEEIRRMVDAIPHTNRLLAVRDRALLLVGFCSACRRSELVALNVDDIRVSSAGMAITIRRSKTDQEGRGREIGILYQPRAEYCPIRAYQAWLKASGIRDGAIWRSVNRHGYLGDRLSAGAVARIVKRAAERAGLDASRYAGHSLRAGLATSAATSGASERAIMKQTGHKSAEMVRRYIRAGTLFRDNVTAEIRM